jgi:hypothetical protein
MKIIFYWEEPEKEQEKKPKVISMQKEKYKSNIKGS